MWAIFDESVAIVSPLLSRQFQTGHYSIEDFESSASANSATSATVAENINREPAKQTSFGKTSGG
jgi:hypothetical protein